MIVTAVEGIVAVVVGQVSDSQEFQRPQTNLQTAVPLADHWQLL